ncbi:Phage tail length tape-measure protein [Alloactinosynnema sp. L-07]|nr:Phage tail length tape-measure protein [Alloactinosynnema sp. L-07]
MGWHVPAGVGVVIGTGLCAAVWLSEGPVPETRTMNAAFSLRAPLTTTSTPSSTPPPAAPVAPPVTTTPPPPPVTTTPPPPPVTTTPPPPKTTTKPKPVTGSCSTTLDGVKPHVAQVGNHIAAKFGVRDIGGVAGRSGTSDHPSGLALDFMVDTATGNAVAEYILANRQAFGVTYVIWRQRYNDGGGWDAMENRGSPTANHMDHVHVSFKAAATVSVSC